MTPENWTALLEQEQQQDYWGELRRFIDLERSLHQVFPAPGQEMTALRRTPLNKVRVVILGQDPYHGPGQAMGMAFSVPRGVRVPPSLENVFKELAADLSIPPAAHGDLSSWADQGVLLLNTSLTVRAGAAGSHSQGNGEARKALPLGGWERFTNRIIEVLAAQTRPLIFVLWGAAARKKKVLIPSPHVILESAHPSPLSASSGFFGSRPFSRINCTLRELGGEPINWRLPT